MALKPKRTSSELVLMMKNKGISFERISEKDAEKYLIEENNYFRTASYRKNFQKILEGQNQGKYSCLDFAYLVELSSIDRCLRSVCYQMCLDIEHSMKVRILSEIENKNECDGYQIVKLFLDKNPEIVKKILRNSTSAYTKDLIFKYFSVGKNFEGRREIQDYSDCPLWVLFEVITFGDFIRFYNFYYGEESEEKKLYTTFELVKSLRNGCAHNNCLLINLRDKGSHAPLALSQEIARIKTISESSRRKKLNTRILLEFSAMLVLYTKYVPKQIGENRIEDLKALVFERMQRNKGFFQKELLIIESYSYVEKLVKYFFPDNKIK